jgi:hypothetical protein
MNAIHHKTNRASPLGFGILRRSTAYIPVGVPPGEGQGEGGNFLFRSPLPNPPPEGEGA